MSTTSQAWQPFTPAPADPWDLGKVAHLHRRAAFGASWSELQRDLKAGLDASVARLLQPRPATAEEIDVTAALRQGVLDAGDAQRLKAWWIYRILYDPDPVREKLTLFWHNHFATSNRKVQSVPLMLEQNELFRRLALGDFAALLEAVACDKAMLVWLDGVESKKGKPNENFAREFLELFTLGTGHFGEPDVREAARAFTGWRRQDPDLHGEAHFSFEPKRFDGGVKTFLGRTGAWKSADIIRIALEQPAAAEFICRKLYRYFVSEVDEPGRELIEPLADELRRHRYEIAHVVGIMLRSGHFYSQAVCRQRVKLPVEFCAGMIHTLDVPPADVRVLAGAASCGRQGQDLFYPPNVKGWDGGPAWLTSMTLLERGNWANDLVWGNPDLGLKPFDPLAWAQRSGVSPPAAMPTLVELLASGSAVPLFLARSADALAASSSTDRGRVLVVVQLDGGNDGLNTVIPHRDDEYRRRRPHLRLNENLLRIDDHIALHHSLHGFAKELEAGRLAIVQSVGYPNPNRSHFESMAIWHAGQVPARPDQPGWLARSLDARVVGQGGDAPALNIDNGQLPAALASGRWQVPTLSSLEQFRRRIGVAADAGEAQQRAALDLVNNLPRRAPNALVDFVQRNTTLTYASSARLERLLTTRPASSGYSDQSGLAQRMRLIAQLIKAGLATSIYYTQLGGFDTHANQEWQHANLLREVGESLHDFLEDLHRAGAGERVLVLVFSEFGRRLAENGSGGTDHGTAAPVFLLGSPVRAGVHGPYPDLHDLDASGDPKHAIDFRQVYATVLENWLQCPADKILGEKFAPLPVLRQA